MVNFGFLVGVIYAKNSICTSAQIIPNVKNTFCTLDVYNMIILLCEISSYEKISINKIKHFRYVMYNQAQDNSTREGKLSINSQCNLGKLERGPQGAALPCFFGP